MMVRDLHGGMSGRRGSKRGKVRSDKAGRRWELIGSHRPRRPTWAGRKMTLVDQHQLSLFVCLACCWNSTKRDSSWTYTLTSTCRRDPPPTSCTLRALASMQVCLTSEWRDQPRAIMSPKSEPIELISFPREADVLWPSLEPRSLAMFRHWLRCTPSPRFSPVDLNLAP